MPQYDKVIRLGTRASKLAVIQAEYVAKLFSQRNPSIQIEIVKLSTPGDVDKTTPLSQLGGKGVFISTLEKALLDETIDVAIHSLKDVTSESSFKLCLDSFLKPEAIEDALVLNSKHPHGLTLETLPLNAKIGTGSLRRQGLIKELRPDCECIAIRGNVETRLNRCEEDLDAVILSKAGLIRLGLEHKISETLNPLTFVPAPGQGVIALQLRRIDFEYRAMFREISDPHQKERSEIELNLLEKLGLGCQFPFGTYTNIDKETVSMTCFIADESLENRRYLQKSWPKADTKKALEDLFKALKDV